MEKVTETLNTILENIIEKNSDDFIKNSSFKVRPGYGPDKFYLDKANQDYESSLENLIHHILFEEELYNHFLNERQLGNCKHVIENEPDSIYRPDLEDEEISDAEYELEEQASETLDDIYASALEFTEDKLWDYDFFEGFSE